MTKSGSYRSLRNRQIRMAYLFLVPAVFILFTFRISPMILAGWISIFDISIPGSPGKTSFIGLKNYIDLFHDESFLRSVVNTFRYCAIVVPSITLIALGLASLLNRKLKLSSLFQTIYFLPIVTSMVAISSVWIWLYQPNFGLINYLLGLLDLPKQTWLLSESLSLVSVAIVIIWANIGYYAVILLAGLKNIPKVYYEAAKIDGADSFNCFTKLTLPLLRPIILFVMVMSTITSLKIFTPVYLLTKGGPMGSSNVVILDVYKNAFLFYRYSYASSEAVVLLMIITGFVVLELRIFRKT